jgi:hypothetical protein
MVSADPRLKRPNKRGSAAGFEAPQAVNALWQATELAHQSIVIPRFAGSSLRKRKEHGEPITLIPSAFDVEDMETVRLPSYDPGAVERLEPVRSPFADNLASVWRAARLEDGWKGPSSLAPTYAAANAVVSVIRALDDYRLKPDRLLPTAAGGFAVYLMSPRKLKDGAHARYTEIEVSSEGTISWAVVDQATHTLESGELGEGSRLSGVVEKTLVEVMEANGPRAR